MAKFIDKLKEVGKDMGRVIKEDPMGTALDVFMTLAIGGYLFLNKMSGYYTGREHAGHDIVDAVRDWMDDLPDPEKEATDDET